MLGWLYRLIIGDFKKCKHEWIVVGKYEKEFVWPKGSKEFGYVVQCKRCGEIKNQAI